MRKISALLLFLIGLSSCASVNVRSFTDPGYRSFKNHENFPVIVVYVPGDFDEEIPLENTFSDKVRENFECRCISYYKLFPPTREYSVQKMLSILNDHKVTGLIILGRKYEDYDESVVKLTSDRETTTGKAETGYSGLTGKLETVYKETKTVEEGKSLTLSKPVAGYEVMFFDVRAGQKAWIAKIASRGTALHSMYGLYRASVDSILDDLEKNGFLKLKESKVEEWDVNADWNERRIDRGNGP